MGARLRAGAATAESTLFAEDDFAAGGADVISAASGSGGGALRDRVESNLMCARPSSDHSLAYGVLETGVSMLRE